MAIAPPRRDTIYGVRNFGTLLAVFNTKYVKNLKTREGKDVSFNQKNR